MHESLALQSIATPEDWFTYDYLVNNGFQNIVATSQTSMEAFEQLLNGEVPLSHLTQHMQASNLKDYIVFSLNTPASTVEQWQQHLDAMKADATFNTIWNRWFEGSPMP